MATLAARAHVLFNGRNAEQVAAVLGLTSEELYARLIDPSLADPPGAGGDVDLSELDADQHVAWPSGANVHADSWGGLVLESYFQINAIGADYNSVQDYLYADPSWGLGLYNYDSPTFDRWTGAQMKATGRADFQHYQGKRVIINPENESDLGSLLFDTIEGSGHAVGIHFRGEEVVPAGLMFHEYTTPWNSVSVVPNNADGHPEVRWHTTGAYQAGVTLDAGGRLLSDTPFYVGDPATRSAAIENGAVGSGDVGSYAYLYSDGSAELYGVDGEGMTLTPHAGGGLDLVGGPLGIGYDASPGVIDFMGDPTDEGAGATLGWDDGFYGAVLRGRTGAGDTELYVVDPDDATRFVNVYTYGGPTLLFHSGIQSGYLYMVAATPGLQIDCDLTFATAKGAILRAPDDTKHRLKVANDGTLSTEVVA